MFDDYNRDKLNQSVPEVPVKHNCIIKMTRDNREIVAVLGICDNDDWRLVGTNDVQAVVKLKSPGKFVASWLAPETPLEICRVENPGFKQRVFSLQFHPYLTEEQWHNMNLLAQKKRLVKSSQRLLTTEDIRVIQNKGQLRKFFEHRTVEETVIVSAVNKDIVSGNHDDLYECLKTNIETQLRR